MTYVDTYVEIKNPENMLGNIWSECEGRGFVGT